MSASCGSKATLSGLQCLPEAARPWAATTETQAIGQPGGGPVDLYVDGSGSMIGFLQGADAERRPFQDLVTHLRSATMGEPGRGVTRRYHLFGSTIKPLGDGGPDLLIRDATYRCPEADRARCNNQESRLDLVLQRVAAAPPNTLSVIVSDLWLSARELEASGSVAVGAPASELLAAGSALGVLGVRAPYQGEIYDLPSGGSTSWSGDRALFVLLAGPVERVTAFRDNLERSGLRGFGAKEARFSLFTGQPIAGRAAGQLSLSGPALTQRTVVRFRSGPGLPQAVLSARAAVRERIAPAATSRSAVRFTADPAQAVRPGAVWRGESEGVTKVWRLQGKEPCRADAWRPAADLPGGWVADGGSARLELPAAELAGRLPKGGAYLLAGELRRTGLHSPNPANAWMREWSFNASSEQAVVQRPGPVFPTLNLAETAQILEAAADDAARRRPVALTGFAAVIASAD